MAFDKIGDALESGLRLIAARLSENLTASGSVATGDLGASITVTTPRIRRGNWRASIEMLEYYEYVDLGRPPGKQPPLQSIIDWLEERNVQDRMTFGREDQFDADAISSIAYMIARKIGEKGTEGNHFATNVFESRLIDDLGGMVAEAAANDIDNLFEEITRITDG
tara:strand:- start:2853 stop:3350 length:498 start_codon:yes stop_codon:yes gene_type:complete